MIKRIFLFLFFFSFTSLFYAKSIPVRVNGLEVKSESYVPMEVEWDEKWFSQCPTSVYHHGIARIAALFSTISYVDVEKAPKDNELYFAYKALGFKEADIEDNYILDYAAPVTGNNQAAYSIASRDIQTAAGTKKLVFIVLRGTPLSANEWISNVDVSDSTHKNTMIHEGFYQTMIKIHTSLIYYLLKKQINPDDAYFLITGHSRGAALANLLGATLEKEGIITGERLFVYTFAAPNVTQMPDYNSSEYDFIWNIVSAEDIVPSVPPNRNNWKWKKYGHIKVLSNYWNVDSKLYSDTYLPKVNQYFSQLLLREYAPFKNGPFIHVQVARVITTFYKTVESYYDGLLSLRNLAEKIFWKIFPDDVSEEALTATDKDSSQKEKKSALVSLLQQKANSNVGEGSFDYVKNAFVDMHACETYFSFLMALDENDCYSDLGSSQIVFDGSCNCAVYDDDGKLLAKVMDGSLNLYSLKIPVAGMPLLGSYVLGFPGNQNVNVIVYKDSIFPTIVSYKIEHYDAAGIFTGEEEKSHFYPQLNSIITFKAGQTTLNSSTINYQKSNYKSKKEIVNQYGLKQNIKFKIMPEFSISTEGIFSLGFRSGNQTLFATLLVDFATKTTNRSYGYSFGLGHQHSLFGKVFLDSEIFNRLIWTPVDVDGYLANVVPMSRISLSYKPRHSLHFFIASAFELHVEKFNDGAFDPLIRRNNMGEITINDRVNLNPSLQFGVRF